MSLCESHSKICPSCPVHQPQHCGRMSSWEFHHKGAVVYLSFPRHILSPQRASLVPANYLSLQAKRALRLLSPAPKTSPPQGPSALFQSSMVGPLVCVIFTTGITPSTVLQSWQVCDKNVPSASNAQRSESKGRPFLRKHWSLVSAHFSFLFLILLPI